MKKIVLFSFLFFVTLNLSAQLNQDSLKAVWNDPAQPDTSRLKAIAMLVNRVYLNINPDSAFYYAQLEYDLAKDAGQTDFMVKALCHQGGAFMKKGEFEEGLLYFNKSLELAEQTNYKTGIARAKRNSGIIYLQQGDLDQAEGLFSQSLALFEEEGDQMGIANSELNLGLLDMQKGDLSNSLEHFQTSSRIFKEIGDENYYLNTQNNIAAVYIKQKAHEEALEIFQENLVAYKAMGNQRRIAGTYANIGSIYTVLEQYEEAKINLKSGLAAFESIPFPPGIAGMSINLGSVYLAEEDYATAIEYNLKGLRIVEQMGAKPLMAHAMNNIQLSYNAQGDHKEALSYALQALPIAREVGDVEAIMNAAKGQYVSYKAMGRYSKALEMHELYVEMQDSFNRIENQKAVIQQQVRSDYENQKALDDLANENAINLEQQKTENVTILSVVVGIALLLISILAIIIFNRLKTTRAQKEIIEEQKKKVEQSEKYKEQFLANMSHEIRTPMHAISGMVKILERNKHPASQDKYLDAMQTSTDNLMVILNDVLDLSKIEAGKLDIQSLPMDVSAIIGNVVQLMQFKAEEKGLTLSQKVAPEVPAYIMGDSTRLNQILLNLVGNGIKFTEKGGVEISLERVEDQLLFRVKDSGSGIPMDKLQSVFDTFQQVGEESGKTKGGTGLGLSISRQLAELQGGRIWVESQEGQGSTFFLEMPCIPATTDAIEAPLITEEKMQEMATSLKGLSVLFAEDNAFNQMIAQDDLSYYIEDVKIDTVENGALALERYQSGNYDLILMDVQMPEMNGFEATRSIREWEKRSGRQKGIPIIAMTASLLKAEIDSCYAAGMDHYIPKPYQPEELVGRIFEGMRS